MPQSLPSETAIISRAIDLYILEVIFNSERSPGPPWRLLQYKENYDLKASKQERGNSKYKQIFKAFSDQNNFCAQSIYM